MRFQAFVDALHEAGWRAPCDAQHTGARKLWARLFPTVAELEAELEDFANEAERQSKLMRWPAPEPTDAELLKLAHAHKYQGPPEADLRILAMLRDARQWRGA